MKNLIIPCILAAVVFSNCTKNYSPLGPRVGEPLAKSTVAQNSRGDLTFTTSYHDEIQEARIIISLKDEDGNIVFEGEVTGALHWTFGQSQLSLEAHGLPGFPCKYGEDNPWRPESLVSPGGSFYLDWASINP